MTPGKSKAFAWERTMRKKHLKKKKEKFPLEKYEKYCNSIAKQFSHLYLQELLKLLFLRETKTKHCHLVNFL